MAAEHSPVPLASLLAGPVAVVITFIVAAAFNIGSGIDWMITAVVGSGLAFAVNGKPRHEEADFVWVLPFFVLLWGIVSSATTWDPTWARMPRWVYVKNKFLGPDCSSSECLGILFSMPAISTASYSLVTFLVRRIARATQGAASQSPADSAMS